MCEPFDLVPHQTIESWMRKNRHRSEKTGGREPFVLDALKNTYSKNKQILFVEYTVYIRYKFIAHNASFS